MIMEQLTVAKSNKRVFKVVLTGGPCGGKTTGQARLSTFFENLGWKVFRVPETASILLSGGVKFADLTAEEALRFQENLLKTMIQIEDAYFQLAESCSRDCLVICDRGTMDASAFVSKEDWDRIMANNGWNSVDLRDTRYNQIIHLVSASKGAEHFYSLEHHSCRSEGLSLARHLDHRAAEAWIGHPYFDVIDNSTDFDTKLRRMINVVCMKVGLDTGDRLETNARKVKYLVGSLPDDSVFPPYEDFDVIHDYLQTNSNRTQARLRKRGQKGHWSYMLSVRRPKQHGQIVETKVPTTSRDYHHMLQQHDPLHFTIYMQRRCFLYNNQYFQLDVFKEPCHPRCRGLVFLETYTTLPLDELAARLPNFLDVRKIVTGDPSYSMYNLSLKEDWQTSKKFCHKLSVEAGEETTDCILPYTNGWTLQSVNGF